MEKNKYQTLSMLLHVIQPKNLRFLYLLGHQVFLESKN